MDYDHIVGFRLELRSMYAVSSISEASATAVQSSNPDAGGMVLVMDKVEIFGSFLGIVPFPHSLTAIQSQVLT